MRRHSWTLPASSSRARVSGRRARSASRRKVSISRPSRRRGAGARRGRRTHVCVRRHRPVATRASGVRRGRWNGDRSSRDSVIQRGAVPAKPGFRFGGSIRRPRWTGSGASGSRAAGPVLVPANLIDGRPPDAILQATSNGAACHSSLHHAVLNGLYEVVERDAMMVTWLKHRSLPRVRLSDDDPDPYGVRAAFTRMSFELTYVDLTSDLGHSRGAFGAGGPAGSELLHLHDGREPVAMSTADQAPSRTLAVHVPPSGRSLALSNAAQCRVPIRLASERCRTI